MKPPLKVIEELGVPTDSYMFAIQMLMQQDADKTEYEKRVQEILGLDDPPECESWYFARVLFLYSVQETIRAYNTGVIPDMELVYEDSLYKTQTYIDNNPWNETRFNIEHGLKTDIDVETGEEGPATAIK